MAFDDWCLVVGVWHGGGDWFLWLVVVASWVWVVASCYLPVASGQGWLRVVGGSKKETEEEKQRVGGEERGIVELEYVIVF